MTAAAPQVRELARATRRDRARAAAAVYCDSREKPAQGQSSYVLYKTSQSDARTRWTRPPRCAAIAAALRAADPLAPTIAAPPMSSDPSGPAFSPLYLQIKLLLTRSLQAGEWKPGEAIPARDRPRRALPASARARCARRSTRWPPRTCVVRRQGKGTFVATHTEEQHPVPLPAHGARRRQAARHGAPLHRLQAHARRRRRSRARSS